MSPAWIRTRARAVSQKNPKGGKSYQVLYRRGGRGYPIETAGTFPTQKVARARRDLVAHWIAAGLNPKDELRKLTLTEPKVKTLREWAVSYETTRLDYSASTAKNLGSHLRRILTDELAGRDPQTLTVADVQRWVADNQWTPDNPEGLKPSSLSRYMGTFRQLLDHASVEPNPARDRTVRLPSIVREEANPPTADQFLRMLRAMPPRYWLPLITIEQTAMRVGEAATLAWGDVDESGNRFRLRSSETKGRRARWVQVPEWLMAIISATVPREDRVAGRRVFAGFTADVAKNAMARACVTAGIPHFHPHDLRHRRATIWHHDGVPTRVLQERGGWSRASIPLDVYTHLMPLDEVPVQTLEQLLVMTG